MKVNYEDFMTRPRECNLKYAIQMHNARQLHYDLRLELDGVLKSWAIPKGPSVDPKTKRLAVKVEDHPIEYGEFEGNISEGEYGAGTVLLWDKGQWIPLTKDPVKALKEGVLRFKIEGEKLGGVWKLIRMKKIDDSSWLLVKEADEFSSKKNVLEDKPFSVKSKKSQKTKLSKATHLDKIYYPVEGYRKIDVLQYYMRVADKMLPHLRGRPLMLIRCPDGQAKECFVQKHWMSSFSKNIKKIRINADEKPYFTVANRDGILELVQLGSLEIHMWNSREDDLENPDQWVFDLDPDPGVDWKNVCQCALNLRDRLLNYNLESFVKVSGGKGLHIVVPVKPKMDWELTKKFTKEICSDLVNVHPDLYVLTMSKLKRKNKIFLDYLRNARGATAVAPYSLRANPHASVSLPVSWQDVMRNIRADAFNIKNIPENLKKNPWKNFFKIKQLPPLGL